VEDGAILKGSVQVQAADQKGKQHQLQTRQAEAPKPPANDMAKATTAAAGA
jgi:hypothetical protein